MIVLLQNKKLGLKIIMRTFRVEIFLPEIPSDVFFINCSDEEEAERIATERFNRQRASHLPYQVSLPTNKIEDITDWTEIKQKRANTFKSQI